MSNYDDDAEFRKMVREMHAFMMAPRAPGKKPRAEEIDDVLAAVRFGRMSGRGLLWMAGLIVALKAAWTPIVAAVASLKGWWTP